MKPDDNKALHQVEGFIVGMSSVAQFMVAL